MFRKILNSLPRREPWEKKLRREIAVDEYKLEKQFREIEKRLAKTKAEVDLMVANSEADLSKAKADRQRTETEVAEKLEELEEYWKRTEPILAEMDRLMAIRPKSPAAHKKCMQLMEKL